MIFIPTNPLVAKVQCTCLVIFSSVVLFMSCRHILAALHFNYNLHREDKVNQDDSVSVKVTYPKFKNGEGTVRNRKIEQNFGIYEF